MKKTIISVALVFLATALYAQNDDTYNESVVVKGSYTPVIEQAEKISFPAQIPDTMGRIEHTFLYSINPTRLRSTYQPTRIRAARIIGEPATKLYHNYLRLGMGNYWTPLADLYWSSTRDRLKTYGVSVNHLSSWDKLLDYGPNQFGNTLATVFGKYIFAEKYQLTSDLSYEHDHNLYHGFTDNTLQNVMGLTRDNIAVGDYSASYNVATWNLGFRNMELDPGKLGYTANVHLSDLWTVWNQNELNLNLSGDVHYGFNIKNQYKGIAYLHAEWDAYKYRYSPDNLPLGRNATPVMVDPNYVGNLVKINPFAVFIFRGLDIHAGFMMAWNTIENGTGPATFQIFPDVMVSKKLMEDNLVLSLAATGGVEANSLNSLRQINPYVMPEIASRGSASAISHYDFIGHARLSISKKLEANAEVSYSLRSGDPTFVLSTLYDLDNVYEVLYNSFNRLTAGGDITFVNDEMITLRAGGHYYHYTGTLTPVWFKYYRPDWDALVAADVNYHDKWFFHLEGQLIGQMESDQGTLPMRYGINAEVEYRHNRALSFFLKMDNLAFQRYWYWANYPSQRGLFIAGLTYTLPQK